MVPLSNDIRQRVLDCYLNEKLSYRKIADRFGVSHSFVFSLIKKYKQTGSICPRPHGGGNPAKIKEEHYELIEKIISENPDGILADFADSFNSYTGSDVSVMAIQRCLKKLKITFKKKREKLRNN